MNEGGYNGPPSFITSTEVMNGLLFHHARVRMTFDRVTHISDVTQCSLSDGSDITTTNLFGSVVKSL